MATLLLTALVSTIIALLWGVVITVQAHEHRRFAQASLRKPPQLWQIPPRVLVCVPCKGIDLDLEANLRRILDQHYSNFQVRFVVEDSADPANVVIERLISATSTPCQLIVAGKCSDSGQKVHNLLRATSDLPPGIDVLVFFDSDARPPLDAIARLVDRVGRGKLQVATGYRWFVPKRPTLANLTLASVNAAVASLLNHQGWNLLWGGGWAITRDLFEKIALADAWRGTLSDDLVASRAARSAGVKLAFEPGCMSATAIDVNWRGAVSFLRRQFVISRCYAPSWWWPTVPLMILQSTVLFGGFGVAIYLAWQGQTLWFAPLMVSSALYGMAGLRARWRQAAWSNTVDASPVALHSAARFDCWAAPWTCLFAAGVMLVSTVGRSITWRGIRYHIGTAGRITLLGRIPNAEEINQLQRTPASHSLQEPARRGDPHVTASRPIYSGLQPQESMLSSDPSRLGTRAA